MTTYLVGLDGSEYGQGALTWAMAVARSDDAIVAAHSWEVPVVTGYEGVTTVDPLGVEEVAEQFVTSTLAERGDPRLSGRVVIGPPGRAIVELAEELRGERGDRDDRDVTVVVGHGGSSKASLLLGSTARHVVHHVDGPVVVVRGEVRLPVRRAVVGVDSGRDDDEPDDRSLVALRWATHLPGLERIEVSHADFVPGVAAGPVREPGLESAEAVADDTALLRHAIERATDGTGVPANGAAVVPVVAAGTGAFALIEASRSVDLVVMGTRARGALLELLLGSTSLEVLAHAHCPVAVVR